LRTAHVRITRSLSCQGSRSRFYCELPNLFCCIFGDGHVPNLAVRGKTSSKLLQLVHCSYGLISVLWIWIWISWHPDLVWLDPDPWKSCRVCGVIFSLGVNLESELWQNPPDQRTWFYIYLCSTQRAVALRRPIFKRKKGLQTLV
jgi:hypothetical protein